MKIHRPLKFDPLHGRIVDAQNQLIAHCTVEVGPDLVTLANRLEMDERVQKANAFDLVAEELFPINGEGEHQKDSQWDGGTVERVAEIVLNVIGE